MQPEFYDNETYEVVSPQEHYMSYIKDEAGDDYMDLNVTTGKEDCFHTQSNSKADSDVLYDNVVHGDSLYGNFAAAPRRI